MYDAKFGLLGDGLTVHKLLFFLLFDKTIKNASRSMENSRLDVTYVVE
jgi:hypothetical protein